MNVIPLDSPEPIAGQPGWLTAHRGPFRFYVTRAFDPPAAGKRGKRGKRKGDGDKGFHCRFRVTAEWLPGEVEKLDAQSEARTLLADPRDTIVSIWLWSVPEGQFIGAFRNGTL